MNKCPGLIILVFLLSGTYSTQVLAANNTVHHYLEASISNNYVFTGGDRLNQQSFYAAGFHIAHGSNITPVHALVMSYGKDYFVKDKAILTGAAFFLRRYMPKYSNKDFLFYSTIGSAYYRYQKTGMPGVMENAGIIIGWGADWVYSRKLRFVLEADYRGFNIRQFGNEATDYIRPVTLFIGLKYFYLSTHYQEKPQK